MNRAAAVRIASAAVMLALAAALVLFARDAWHWGRAIRDADARAALQPVSPDTWQADTAFPGGAVRRILGIDDDLAFRRAAMGLYSLKTKKASNKDIILVETNLERIVETDTDHARASRAADYLGLLFYANRSQPQQAISPYVKPNTPGAQSPTQTGEQKAVVEFQTAVRLDPGNANAKRNLEAMLQQAKAASEQGTPKPGSGEKTGSKGSGSRPPGNGY